MEVKEEGLMRCTWVLLDGKEENGWPMGDGGLREFEDWTGQRCALIVMIGKMGAACKYDSCLIASCKTEAL